LDEVIFTKAYYIKLGAGHKWFESSIRENKIRFGWGNIPIDLIKNKDWGKIYPLNRQSSTDYGSTTRDSNALKNIIEADEKTMFITFENSCLYWCKARQDVIVDQDDISIEGVTHIRKDNLQFRPVARSPVSPTTGIWNGLPARRLGFHNQFVINWQKIRREFGI
jgi:hypothetical protein